VTTSPSPQSTSNKIAVIGGALDPITLGHIHLGQELEKTGLFREIWYMPCYGHLGKSNLAPAKDRETMCRLSTAGTNLLVSSWEISHKHTGSTYETLVQLREAYPGTEFYWVIGSDNVDEVPMWERADDLLAEFGFVIIPRGGVEPPDSDWYLEHPHIYFEDMVLSHISSTMFRDAFQDNDVATYRVCVHPRVLEYLSADDKIRLYRKPGMNYCGICDISARIWHQFPEGDDFPAGAQFKLSDRCCNPSLRDSGYWVSIGLSYKNGVYRPLWDINLTAKDYTKNKALVLERLARACRNSGYEMCEETIIQPATESVE
jgi:nicotinate-nucleotide adenylyltransferase